ncbi:MAG: winged helix DNA-binding protein [Eubacteriales bacterium]|nr:winged helix DNA-binding protein [Eubacteriales bacterium]
MDFNDTIRNILRIGRNIRVYYDRELQEYGIGWAQQHLLLHIYGNPGSTAQELRDVFLTEKSAISKGIRKLYEEGYVRIETDEQDRRAKRLYPTEKAEEAVRAIREIQSRMSESLSLEFTEQGKKNLDKDLKKFFRVTDRGIGEKSSEQHQYEE